MGGSTDCRSPGAHTPRFIACSDDHWSLAFSMRQPAGVIAVRKPQLIVALLVT